jgi:hypothetical protein
MPADEQGSSVRNIMCQNGTSKRRKYCESLVLWLTDDECRSRFSDVKGAENHRYSPFWGNDMKQYLAQATVLLVMALSQPAVAGPVVSGFNTTTVQRCDDCFTAAVPLGFSANFFGGPYSSTFVSNNGYVTFGSGQGTFTPVGLGAGYGGQPIIAPFFADVDTSPENGGTTSYGTGSFDGHAAFGVTWTDVGYFSSRTDKTNTFQTLLVDRSDVAGGDVDIYFNYDRILWETGAASGGTLGLGGISASAGYNAGSNSPGSFGQLPGSLVNGALLDNGQNSLVANSNIGVAGRYLFGVRSGRVVDQPGPVSAAPEPASWALMIVGFGAAGASLRRRRSHDRRKTVLA